MIVAETLPNQNKGLPKHLIIHDVAFSKVRPDNAFFLRVDQGNEVQFVSLPGASWPSEARAKAVAMGFEPEFYALILPTGTQLNAF